MERTGNSTGNSERIASGDQVRREELDLIAERRREEFSSNQKVAPQMVADNLVGLALSGGGIRSAAFSLGLLQALHRTRVLSFVDYLSTVSGGGYAGAFLTSVALRRHRSTRLTAGSDNGDGDGSNDESFPIGSGADARTSRRMLRFIHGGNYLAHWWQFFNRYLVGLLLMLTVVVSGLVAASAGIAWLFRCIDHHESRDWLWALGFKDDLAIAIFPSFLLLLLWSVCWVASYYKRGSRATGRVAQFVFCLLVLSTATAVAVLIGNGEINLGGLEAAWGRAPKTGRAESIAGWVWTAILTAIGAAMLPYLSPKRLLRSGIQGKSALERGIFWVATRALVFGVPFVLIAWFARENISHWNELRDDRITAVELASHPDESGGTWSPFWRYLKSEWDRSTHPPQSQVPSLAHLQLVSTVRTDSPETSPLTPGAYLWGGSPGADPSLLETRLQFCQTAEALQQGRGIEATSLRSGNLDEAARWERALTGADHELRFYERWGSLAALPCQRLFHDDAAESNRLHSMVELRRSIREVKREMMYIVNCRLLDPTFYQLFEIDTLQQIYPGRSDKSWDELELLTKEAERLRGSVFAPEHAGAGHEGDNVACQHCLGSMPTAELDPEWDPSVLPRLIYAFNADNPEEERYQRQLLARIHATPASEHAQYQDHDRNGQPDLEDEETQPVSGPLDSQRRQAARHNIVRREHRDRAVLDVNRRLLAALYPDSLRDRDEVRSYVVLSKDQETRLHWFFWALGIFIVSSLLTDLNAISWHGYYARQVAAMWTEPVPGLGRDIPLGQLETVQVGRPYHLITASLHLVGRSEEGVDYPKHRGHFLFSQRYCGSDSLGYRETGDWMDGQYQLADAVAVSGGAVSPLENSNPLIAALLTLANVRMGQWVQNPRFISRRPLVQKAASMIPFTPFRFLMRLPQNPVDRPFVFVADGGHHENLGIEPLLKRRCRLIIASDAGMDGGYEFADFTRLLRWSRILHGIRFQTMDGCEIVSFDDITPDPDRSGLSGSHFALLRIVYPEGDSRSERGEDGADANALNTRVGFLVYLKTSLLGDEPIDLAQYRRQNSEFPHDSSADQFFDPERFESYRQLGDKIGEAVCGELRGSLRGDGSPESMRAFIDEFTASVARKKHPEGSVPEQTGTATTPVAAPIDGAQDATSPVPPTPEALRPLLEQLASDKTGSPQREAAALDIARFGVVNHEIVVTLLNAALSSDDFVARSARHALEEFGPRVVPILRDVALAGDRPKCQSLAAGLLDAIYQDRIARRRRGQTGVGDDESYDEQLVEILLRLYRKGTTRKVRKQAGFSLDRYLAWMQPALTPKQRDSAAAILEELRQGQSRRAGTRGAA